jgi:hypothetical protein
MGYRVRNNNYPGVRSEPCEEPVICHEEQRHVHELQGSVKFAEEDDPHNHRFCTVTGEAIPYGGDDHVHDVAFRTDFYEDHFHEFIGRTGCAVPVGDRHVHYIEAVTSVDDGHRHAFEAATLIENPTGDDCRKGKHDHEHDHYHRDDRRY